MAQKTLIQNVNVLLPDCESWMSDSSVLIEDDVIYEINPNETMLDSEIIHIQGEGQYLLPGLIEMHGHFYGRATKQMCSQHKGYCPLYLAGGVTTVRTPGELEPELTYQWKQAIESGQAIGPRILSGGWYFDRSPSIVGWFDNCETIEEIDKCFEKRDKFSDFFKVYSNMPLDWIQKVCDLGHAKEKKVYGHLGISSTIGAIKAGLDGIEHGLFTIQEFHSKPSSMVDMDGLDRLDMESKVIRQVQEVIIKHGTAVTPTSITFMLRGAEYTDWLNKIDAWRYLSPEACQQHIEKRQEWDSDQNIVDQQKRLMEKQRRFVGDLYHNGARIFCGTDPSYPLILPGKALVWEAVNLSECGMPASAVLKALTIEAAKELSLDSKTGSISKNKQADLVLLKKDPLKDIQHLDTVQMVWKAGKMHNPEDLRNSAQGQIG